MKGKELENIIKSLRLTNTEAAGLLEISRQTLYTWITQESLNKKQVKKIEDKLNLSKLFPDLQNFGSFALEEKPALYNSKSSELNQIPFSDYMEADFLSIEAQAGYLDSLETHIKPKLDKMLIPKEFEKGNYLVVEILGDSMTDGTSRSIQDGFRLL